MAQPRVCKRLLRAAEVAVVRLADLAGPGAQATPEVAVAPEVDQALAAVAVAADQVAEATTVVVVVLAAATEAVGAAEEAVASEATGIR
jgi:hypothetical protein